MNVDVAVCRRSLSLSIYLDSLSCASPAPRPRPLSPTFQPSRLPSIPLISCFTSNSSIFDLLYYFARFCPLSRRLITLSSSTRHIRHPLHQRYCPSLFSIGSYRSCSFLLLFSSSSATSPLFSSPPRRLSVARFIAPPLNPGSLVPRWLSPFLAIQQRKSVKDIGLD